MIEIKLFMVKQKLYVDNVDGCAVDNDEINLGFITDEYLAKDFCRKHSNCSYQEIDVKNCPVCLEENMASFDDLTAITIPLKLPNDDDVEDDGVSGFE